MSNWNIMEYIDISQNLIKICLLQKSPFQIILVVGIYINQILKLDEIEFLIFIFIYFNIYYLKKQITTVFVCAATKVVLQNRAKKYIQKIKDFLGNARTRQEVKKLVQESWQSAEYQGVGKKDFVFFFFKYI